MVTVFIKSILLLVRSELCDKSRPLPCKMPFSHDEPISKNSQTEEALHAHPSLLKMYLNGFVLYITPCTISFFLYSNQASTSSSLSLKNSSKIINYVLRPLLEKLQRQQNWTHQRSFAFKSDSFLRQRRFKNIHPKNHKHYMCLRDGVFFAFLPFSFL